MQPENVIPLPQTQQPKLELVLTDQGFSIVTENLSVELQAHIIAQLSQNLAQFITAQLNQNIQQINESQNQQSQGE